MKKVFFIILSLFILTGCEANYNLEIFDDHVTESSDFLLEKNDDNEIILDDYYNTNYLAFYDMDSLKDNMYNKKRIDDGKHFGMNLNYVYYKNQYQNSSLLDKCYYKKSFISSDDYIILYTEGGASCFYKDEEKLLDLLTINIKTDLTVLENNADKVTGNTYIWKLDSSNFSEKDIYIKIKRSGKFNFVFLAIILIILVVVGIFVLRVKLISDKKNKL